VTSHRTLKALRDQGETAQAAAKAAKESADAALQNAKAVVNSQRPWIFIKYTITGDSPRKADIEIRGVNYGPTPAEIVCIDFTCVKQERAASLPIEPSYRKLPNTYSGHVRPGGDFGIFKTLLASEMTDEMWEEMDRKNQRLTYRGRVIYKDVMSGERHESRFYYYFSPQPGGGMIDRSAPPEYYRHT
jgi:hypothetical protein